MLPISSFLQKPPKTNFDGQENNEKVLYLVRRSWMTNIPWVFMSIVFVFVPIIATPFIRGIKVDGVPLVGYSFIAPSVFFWYLFVFGFVFQNFVNWFFNILIISDKKIMDIDFHGITYKNISETTLRNVEDVTSRVSGTLGTIFDIGNVYIQTAGEQLEFEFINVANPSKVRDVISDLVAEIKTHGNN